MRGSKPEWPFDSVNKLNCLSSSFAASLFHRGALLAGIECESTKGQSTAAVARSVLPFLLPCGLLSKFDFLRDTVTKKFKSRVVLVMEGRSFSHDEGKQKDKDKNIQCWICVECLEFF